MVRPRKTDTHLPVGVYFRHGAYYRVVGGKWIRLGTELPEATVAAVAIHSALLGQKAELLAAARLVLTRARQNAKARRGGIEFSLSREDVHRMLNEAGWRCAVTGALFSLEVINGRRPLAPSIDRIDSSLGYTRQNCRIVCAAVNYAMNVWGEDVLWRLFKKRPLLDVSNTAIGHTDASR